MLIRELPPLRQSTILETPSGRRYRWAEDESRPENIPSGVRHSDTMPGGYETWDATLPRDPAVDYADLEPLSTVHEYDAGGEKVGEYRLERAPRVSGDQLAISPSAVGWQAHLDDDKTATALIIDRDLGRWQGMSRQRHLDIGSGVNPQNDGTVLPDPTSGEPAIKLDLSGHLAGTSGGMSEYWYPAGAGNQIGALHLESTERQNHSGWTFRSLAADDDLYTNFITVMADQGDASVAFRRDTLSTPKRWAALQVEYLATLTTDENERWRMVKNVAVVGDHGLTLQEVGAGEDGFLASDIVRYLVQRFAPLLNVTAESISASGFVIPHLTFPEATTASEMIRQATRFGLQDWAVWNDKTFWWHDRGQFSKNWRARVGPAQLEETGPQVDRLFESVLVQYKDVDGSTRTVGPAGSGAGTESADLKDDDPDNPANKLGITRRALLTMDTTTVAGATEIGRRFLIEQKALDSSGRAVFVGHVMDDRGVLFPYSRVRAGDSVSFVDAADPSPRRIVRTEKDRPSRSCRVDLDAPPEGLQALLERLGVVLTGVV